MTDRERFAYVTRRGLRPACDGLATNDLGEWSKVVEFDTRWAGESDVGLMSV